MMMQVHARRPDGSDGGQLTTWTDVQVVDRWRDVGRWVLTLADPAEAALVERGGGVIVRRGDTTIMSGPWDSRQVTQEGSSQTTTLSGPDDTVLLAQTLAWPSPSAAISAQGAYDTRTGNAEELILAYAGANFARLGRAVTLPASQGRGGSLTVRARFLTLLEVAQKCAAADSSLGFRLVQQADRGVGVDVWSASDLSGGVGLFSDAVGNANAWTYTEAPPQLTRVVVAGGEQLAARWLRSYTAESVGGLEGSESDWRMVAEGFVDRRDVDVEDATANTELAEAGQEALVEGQAKVALRVQVEDTAPGLQYGVDFRIGDLVSVFPAGLEVRDRITEAVLTVTREGGERVALWVGQKDDDPEETVERRARDFGRRLSALERSY